MNRAVLVLLCALVGDSFAAAPPPPVVPVNPLTFCRFGPKLRVVESGNPTQGCDALIRIQALMWECAPADKAQEVVSGFFDALKKRATVECQKLCSDRGADCKGDVNLPSLCGLSTDASNAPEWGKKLGCGAGCTGQAMAYCSLYNAGYQGEHPEQIKDAPANCHCYKSAPGI